MKANKLPGADLSEPVVLTMLKAEHASQIGKNVTISPVLMLASIGLLANGMNTEEQGKLFALLGASKHTNLDALNQSYPLLLRSLAETNEVDFDLANSLYLSAKAFTPEILAIARLYDARLQELLFADPAASLVMNSFTCQRTKGKIPAIVQADDTAAGTELVSLSAAYFRGNAKIGFDRLHIDEVPFAAVDGKSTYAKLLYKSGRLAAQSNSTYKAVRLPYGADGRFALYVFLPEKQGSAGLDDTLDSLIQSGISSLASKFQVQNAEVLLPRFRAEYSSTDAAAFDALSLNKLWASSTFAGISAPGIHKLSFRQKTVFELDEAGAKIRAKSSGNVFTLRAHRAFIALARDEQTGAICAAAIVNQPASKSP